jgi:predicted AAA+ superfamily ATPase
MIERKLHEKLIQLVEKFPVVSVTGPRQSGKTTLLKTHFPDYHYETLEDPDTRLFAQSDPRRFLRSGEKMIIDEIQRVPELFSFIQSISDSSNMNGQYIISGSQSFLLNQHISQSLAGRVAILTLLPLSLTELQNHGLSVDNYEDYIYKGFYPRLYDKKIEPIDFYPNYIQTYIERDLRLLQNIQNLTLFIRFLKLCAGRIGQLLNMSSLANDCGISINTAKSWLSVLEASYVIILLQPHHINFNKRLVKMPKLFFYDTGLASSLLELHSANQLSTYYLRGALFENFILAELLKNRFNAGFKNNCFFWRDNKGNEVDCLIDDGIKLTPIEIKSGHTFNQEFFKNINYWNKISGNSIENAFIIYGGAISRKTQNGMLLAWKDMHVINQ